jgi:WD40 repeat protein
MDEKNNQMSIYDLSIGSKDKSQFKLKISDSLEKLNKSSLVFDDMINDYNTLYTKYINIQLMAEQNQRFNKLQLMKVKENVSKMDPAELEQAYNSLQEEFLKIKNSKEETLVNLTKNLQTIMDLKSKLDLKEKKIMGLTTENASLKSQNMLLDKRNKELNEISQKQEKELIDIKKEKTKIETEHKKLLDKTGKMLMEIELLRNKLLELQENTINKMNDYNELIQSAKQKQMAADLYFNEKSEEYKKTKKEDDNLNEKFGFSEEVKIPNNVKYRQKIHNKVITSINFNNFGSSYITTGADYVIKVFDAAKNIETNVFSGFSSAVSEACFDHTEQLLFAGSLDKTAKLWSLRNNKLLNTFNGHIDYINCVKSLNAQQRGITGSSDRTIREWDYNTNKETRKLSCVSACHALGIAPDDSFIISGHLDGTIKIWVPNNNKQPEHIFDSLHDDKVLDIKMIKNDTFISLGKDETIKLFDIRKEQAIFTLTSSKIPQYCESSIAVSPDKKYCAIGSTKGSIYIINLNDGNVESTINNKGNGAIKGLCWRPFNSQIYVGDSMGYLTIWGTSMGMK